MFTSLKVRLVDVQRKSCNAITDPVLEKFPLHVCDTIETVKSVLSQVLRVPMEYMSLWCSDIPTRITGKENFIGMKVDNCAYTFTDMYKRTIDPMFDNAKSTAGAFRPLQTDDKNTDAKDQDCDDSDEDRGDVFGQFGAMSDIGFGTSSSTKVVSSTLSRHPANFLQENFMFDTTTSISSFINVYTDTKQSNTVTIFVVLTDLNTYRTCGPHEKNGWLAKYWGRATDRSKVQEMSADVAKYFEIKRRLLDISQRIEPVTLRERISVVEYRSKKSQDQQATKRVNRYGENIFAAISPTRLMPFISLQIPELESHKFSLYVADNTVVGVDDVEKFILQTQKVNGLSLRMVNPNVSLDDMVDKKDKKSMTFVSIDYKPEYTEITSVDETTVLDTTVHAEQYSSHELCNNILNSTIHESNLIYQQFLRHLDTVEFNYSEVVELSKLSLKWKMYVPAVRVADIIDKKIIASLFKKVNLNASQQKSGYISQNFLKFEYDPCLWNKMGNNSNTKITCTIRTTSSNSIIVTISATVMKRKLQTSKANSKIDIFLIMWVYDIWRCMILDKLGNKTTGSRLTGALRLKDIDPYLFGDSVKKGGYTRKCLNYKDERLGLRRRYKQPMVINMDNEEDMKMYNNLKYPSYIVKYRNNYYVGMKDELENGPQIEQYNAGCAESTDKMIEYFNTVVFFEIHEDEYRAPNTDAGMLYPTCVQRKDRLSRRHIDLMRQAYLDGQIEIFGVGREELIKQLESHEFTSNAEVGYIMQASRTLSINSFGHLPSDGTWVYEWFRQGVEKFVKNNCEFLRKGTMHDDEFNFVHAVFDALDHKRYQSLTAKDRKALVRASTLRWADVCSFALFRTLQDGMLAQRYNYTSFISFLQRPTAQLLHTEFADLFGYCLSVNIVIFDCDTRSHTTSSIPSADKQNSPTSSSKMYYTTLNYSKYIFLLKMRGIYEPIVFYSDTGQKSCFTSDDYVVRQLMTLTRTELNPMTDLLARLNSEFRIAGQVLNANNQCTHIVLALSNVPIPINGICVPFKNGNDRYVPIMKYCVCNVAETYQVMIHIADKFAQYTPESVIYEKRPHVGENGTSSFKDVAYAIRLHCGLFCDIEPIELTSPDVPSTLRKESNLSLHDPYYPDTVNAIILGEKHTDDRIDFIGKLDLVQKCFVYLKTMWHKLVNEFPDTHPNKQELFQSYTMPNQQRRRYITAKVEKMWTSTINNPTVSPRIIGIMTQYQSQLLFVLMNYLYRNPRFFELPLKQRNSKVDNGSRGRLSNNDTEPVASIEDVLQFNSVPSLMSYLEECTKTQISHLHVTVKRQKRITYPVPVTDFVVLDEPVECSDVHVNDKEMFIGDILTVIFYYLRHTLSDNTKQMYQTLSFKWLKTFDPARPLLGVSPQHTVTFGELIARDDMADACLSLSVILNKTIEVIDLRYRTKHTYGSSLSYRDDDKIHIYYNGKRTFCTRRRASQ